MNETLNNIYKRRSTKSYNGIQIENDKLDAILKAAIWAPSGMNLQTWKFVVVQDKKVIDTLTKGTGVPSRPDQFYNAPTIVLTFVEKNAKNGVKDGSLAMGNMMLAATSLDVGSCWINCVQDYFKTDEGVVLAKSWDLENYTCIGSVVLGYSDEPLPKEKPRKDNTIIRI